MSKRPQNLIYTVDEKPPLLKLIVLGLQQVSIVSISLLIPILVAQAAGVDQASLLNIISFSMIAIGIASLLQGFRLGPVGAGYLIPGFCSATYLPASLTAVQIGGLPLVYGMTLIAGLFETFLSRFIVRLRPFFPPEISGIAVTIIGLELGLIAVKQMFDVDHQSVHPPLTISIALLTFFLAALLSIYGKGVFYLFSALISIISGYLSAFWLDLIPSESWHWLHQTPVLSLPNTNHISWSFDANLLLPFLLAAVAASLKTIGAVSTCQKINDAEWKRPEIKSIQRGVAADGLSTVIAGCLGSTGQNSATSGIGISNATGATSRYIAITIAIWFFLLASLPKIAALFIIMPDSVRGGALMFSACYMAISGIQIISSRLLDDRRTVIVGFSIILAVSRSIFPEYYESMPESLQPFTSSSLAVGLSTAMLLNLALRIGIKKNSKLYLDPNDFQPDQAWVFMQKLGTQWAAREDVINRASFSLTQLIELIVESTHPRGAITIESSFDEYHVDIRASYQGELIELSNTAPDAILLRQAEGQRKLAGFLMRRLADRVQIEEKAGKVTIILRYNH